MPQSKSSSVFLKKVFFIFLSVFFFSLLRLKGKVRNIPREFPLRRRRED
jgi:hypothetical protein